MMWGYYGGEWWWMLIGMVSMILFWGTIILLVIWGVKRFTGDRGGITSSQETPLEIAQRRLARVRLPMRSSRNYGGLFSRAF